MQNFAALRAPVFPLFMKNLKGANIHPPPVGARVKDFETSRQGLIKIKTLGIDWGFGTVSQGLT